MNYTNNLITFLKQNNIKEILNLFGNQDKEFDAQVVGVEGDRLILNVGSKTILAQNSSSFFSIQVTGCVLQILCGKMASLHSR